MTMPVNRNAAFFIAGAFLAALFLGGAAHAITNTVFKYSSPKTGHYSVHRFAMSPVDSDSAADYSKNQGTDGLQIYVTGCLSTGINLPTAATITNFTVWYKTSTPSDANVVWYRHSLSDDSAEEIASYTFPNSSNVRKAASMTPNAGTEVVSNNTYMYALLFCAQDGGASFYGARINYTYITAGD